MVDRFTEIAVIHWSRERKLTWLDASGVIAVNAQPPSCATDAELSDEILCRIDARQAVTR